MTLPLCSSDPSLWSSTSILDHIEARKGCARCGQVQACVAESLAIAGETAHQGVDLRGPDGTWGGVLWINGTIQVRTPTRNSGQPEGPRTEVA